MNNILEAIKGKPYCVLGIMKKSSDMEEKEYSHLIQASYLVEIYRSCSGR
jgi:hypothetical protein